VAILAFCYGPCEIFYFQFYYYYFRQLTLLAFRASIIRFV